MKKNLLSYVFGFLLVSNLAQATIAPVSIRPVQIKKQDRWIFTKELNIDHTRGDARELAQVKRLQLQKKDLSCFRKAKSLKESVSLAAPWLSVFELQCGTQAFIKKQIKGDEFYSTIRKVKKDFLLSGVQKSELRKALLEAQLELLKYDIKKNRGRAWSLIDQMNREEEWTGRSQKAQVARLASELAFIEQKMPAARKYALKSLRFEESAEVRDKLITIEKAISKETPLEAFAAIPSLPKVGKEISEDELRLKARVDVALRRGNLTAAAEEALNIIKDYPASQYSQWSEKQILQAYLKALQKEGGKNFSAAKKILRIMKKADGLRLSDWAHQLFRREKYEGALEIGEAAIGKLKGTRRVKKLLNIVALSALYTGDLGRSEKRWSELIGKSKGSDVALEAMFRLSLLHYRKKQYSKSVALLEKLLFLPAASKYELSVMYWLWRSLEPIDKARALKERDRLIESYPLTYYGLRAQIEAKGEVLLPEKKAVKVKKAKVWLTFAQRKKLQRIQLFLNAGWLEEASLELNELPAPQTDREKRIFATYWSRAMNFSKATSLAQQTWGQPERLKTKGYLEATFPTEFLQEIKQESKSHKISENLLLAIIRQESAFYPRAVSRSRALGLMQLMPATATSLALESKMKNFVPGVDLFKSSVNLQLGTKYISRLLKRFNGNFPLALAAYNAGPTKVARWLGQRDLFEKVKNSKTSSAEIEVWIDEIPWSETRHYVKAVMRNYLAYSLLGKGRVQKKDPLWL